MRRILMDVAAVVLVLAGTGTAQACGCCCRGGNSPQQGSCPNCPKSGSAYGSYYWSSAYGCYLYYDAATRASYYWSARDGRYLPAQDSPPAGAAPHRTLPPPPLTRPSITAPTQGKARRRVPARPLTGGRRPVR